jgi:SAM-dependent methyltransferase
LTHDAPEIRAAVRAALPLQPTMRLLASGSATVLDAADVARVAHVAMVGDTAWPDGAASVVVAADPRRLPFVAGMFDAALAMTPLDAPGLRELWRVLAPAGVLIAVVPRRSLLPRNTGLDGAQHSQRSLTRLLDAAMFEPDRWTRVAGVHVVRATKRDGLAPIGGSGGTPARARLAPA